MESLLRFLFSVFFILLNSHSVWSAACCGGGLSVPTIITSDDKAQFSTSFTSMDVVIDNVDARSIWRKWDQHQRTQTFKMEGAHIISDRWQVGASVPAIKREFDNQSFSGLGDIATSLSYEYLPDWNYNPYRPRGIGFVQLVLPTGKSRADSEVGGLDSRGNGFWAYGAGTLLSKVWNRWDVFVSLEMHRSLAKKINNSLVNGTVIPGNGANVGAGAGYNWSDYRVGLGMLETTENEIHITSKDGLNDSVQGNERWSTFSASFSYLQSEQWSWTVVYTDQTLLGNPINTSLGMSVGIQFQHRWFR